MIRFVTDTLIGEPDILGPVCMVALEVRSLDGYLIERMAAPEAGWTHPELMAVGYRLRGATDGGADAYLGGDWVGSTEV